MLHAVVYSACQWFTVLYWLAIAAALLRVAYVMGRDESPRA